MNWLVSKYSENPDQISLLNPFDDLKAEYGFYNFKLEDQCVPNQVDGWNCGIGTSLTIMRFSTFMNRFETSSRWIETNNTKKKQHQGIRM